MNSTARSVWSHAALGLCLCMPACSGPADPPTTVVLVRHAEKEDGDDPGLSVEGYERAARLAHAVSEAGVDAIYASQFRRTRETAERVASSVGLEVEVVDARDIEGLATRLRSEHAGETVLVVSHSNIIPEVIRALGAEQAEIPEEEYDDLFAVVLDGAARTATAVHLNYGAVSGGD